MLHALRLALLFGVVLILHLRHQVNLRTSAATQHDDQLLPRITQVLPNAAAISESHLIDGVHLLAIADLLGNRIGYAARTSPDSDSIIGFSGPTDTLCVFDTKKNLLAATVIDSQDTRDHVQRVLDSRFLEQLNGRSISELQTPENVDATSGATLTSMAIIEAIRNRLRPAFATSSAPIVSTSLKFPAPLNLESVQKFYPKATAIAFDSAAGLWRVSTEHGQLGNVLRSSPAADNAVGYQGPTDSLVAVDATGEVIGLAVGPSFDNEPYVAYVREDRSFAKLFNGRNLSEIAKIDLIEEGIEGVSGATMTSQNVAQGVILAAIAYDKRRMNRSAVPDAEPVWLVDYARRQISLRNLSTIWLVVLATVLGLTSWKRRRWLRLLFQVLLIGWLGLLNGDMLSQALLAGWAQNGVPVNGALGLVCLTLVAFVVPITTGKNVYCAHICPHGAVQQLVRNRLPWKLTLSRRTQTMLQFIPTLLLVWVLLVVMLRLPFSLVDIEPFDAWLWTITGAASLTIALLGLGLSLFVPMAYCRYGCPTGRLLEYVRKSNHGKWSHRDTAGCLLFALALVLFVVA